ncbi:hypothetical protein D3C72_1909100 [compost metagenome]
MTPLALAPAGFSSLRRSLAICCTLAGAFLCLMSMAESEVGNFSGMVMAALRIVTLPPSVGVAVSGPVKVISPASCALNSVPST